MKLEVNNLNFSYGMKKVLNISDVSFESGNIYGIVGKNGAGKTTFFKSLTNIIVNYSGNVFIDGENVKQNPTILTSVGIVLDDMELYKHQSGLFNLQFFGGLRGNFDEQKALELAKELELADDINKKVSSYSLGMNKKLILLISIMNDAQILILDEPFRGLDAKSVEWFKDYLLELKKQGKMIFISSHIQEDIQSLSDRVLVLENGDFAGNFDLNKEDLNYIYQVEVNKVDEFIELLKTKEISGSKNKNMVKFSANEETYKELFNQAVASGIEFYQIKKMSEFTQMWGD
ncbi:MAG: ABC transporter ATP-binding protein [Streptococcaceae bacterium]|jgi:ABC-2 type transport system ATP-binding protein|nr:ABC transporter ATP-binding protein [Streptococcaceae bacterium]